MSAQSNESPPPAISELQRTLPTPFLSKTYQMVEDPAVNDVISWNDEGSAFVVWRPAEFALDLLPKYFKHNNFSSFVRQLNTYGFRKIVPDRWEFSNDSFKRGEKRLLSDIHRRKITLPTVAVAVALPLALPSALANLSGSSVNLSVSSTDSVEVTAGSTSIPKADLADENERLRKENRDLANELSQLKSICNNIFLLMSKYATGNRPPEALDLMPVNRMLEEAEEICDKSDEHLQSANRMLEEAEEICDKSDEHLQSATPPTGSCEWYYDANPMLFGVSIGEKRCREENDGEEENTMAVNLPPEGEVKLEPVDSEMAEQQKPWVVYYPRPKRLCDEKEEAFKERDGEST